MRKGNTRERRSKVWRQTRRVLCTELPKTSVKHDNRIKLENGRVVLDLR